MKKLILFSLFAPLALIAQVTVPNNCGATSSNSGGSPACSTAHGLTNTVEGCADSSGSGTAQVCNTTTTFTPAAGDCIIYTTTTANSGAGLTINVNSLGAKSVQKWLSTTTLTANDVRANIPIQMCYDGTDWNMGTIGNAPSGAVSSVSGDGTLITNSSSTGAVTLATGNAAAYSFFGNNTGSTAAPAYHTIPAAALPDVPVLISTSGPVADPGGPSYYQFNNATGALTFDLPAGVAGIQRCYRNSTTRTGVVTIAVTTSNTIDLNGANGTTTTGTLVSGGAAGDAVCLVSDAANHWMAYVQKGTWTNN